MNYSEDKKINKDTYKLAKKKGFPNLGLPTQESLHSWIRKNHNKEVMVKSWIEGQTIVFLFSCNVLGKPSAYKNKNNFIEYEDAFEAGLIDALNSI